MSNAETRDQALFFAGNRLLAAGNGAAAERCFRRALALNPGFAEVWTNLGLLRERAGAVDEALDCYRRAVDLRPDGLQLQLNLGAMLMERGRFAEADDCLAQALRIDPGSAVAWSHLGVLMAHLNRDAEAERCCRTAIRLDADHAQARFNLSYVLLRQGRYAEGWDCLESRRWYDRLAHCFACPRWRGEPLDGRAVLVGLEAGHGDMIQFCRYVPELKRLGATRVGVVCHPGLTTLFRTLPGIDVVCSASGELALSGWDYWTPPLSLPYHCRTRLESIPAPIPYLTADPALVDQWAGELPTGRPLVGLVWKGNPRFENDADRSLPSLDLLAPLAGLDGVGFVSLQQGAGEDEARHPPPGFELSALGEHLTDFADTAAVIASLDLVISVDTAVAHLAGALGKPCWVMLPDHMPDWRWLTGRTDSPWYPGTMRLFRQPPGGGWTPVVAGVFGALREWARARGLA